MEDGLAASFGGAETGKLIMSGNFDNGWKYNL
jgi:hypothetical protein